jgi:sugar phosphate isomerase/epimerase
MRAVEVMRGLIELCADLGGKILVHGSPGARQIAQGQSPEAALAHASECFAAIATNAEQAGVTYCIEPLAKSETPLINTVEEAANIVRAIGSPAVRTMLDACAAGQAEASPIPDVLDRWLPTGVVAHIHLNDPNGARLARASCALRRSSQPCGARATRASPQSSRSSTSPTGRPAPRARWGYLKGLLEALEGR